MRKQGSTLSEIRAPQSISSIPPEHLEHVLSGRKFKQHYDILIKKAQSCPIGRLYLPITTTKVSPDLQSRASSSRLEQLDLLSAEMSRIYRHVTESRAVLGWQSFPRAI